MRVDKGIAFKIQFPWILLLFILIFFLISQFIYITKYEALEEHKGIHRKAVALCETLRVESLDLLIFLEIYSRDKNQ